MRVLRGLVELERATVLPSDMPEVVDHFSIPALDAGAPERVTRGDIDSHKLVLVGGEVLVSRLNPRKPRVHLVPLPLDTFSVASTEFVAMRPHGVNTRFLRFFLLSEAVRQELDSQVRSATRSHQRVEPAVILGLRVGVLSDQQRRIADFLDDRVARIDSVIAAREAQIGLVRQEYVSWVDVFVSWLTRMHSHAPMRRHVVRIEQGWSPVAQSSPALLGEPGVIKLGAVRAGEFRADQNKAFLEDSVPRPEYWIDEGDLLITRANTPTLVGDVAVAHNIGQSRLYLSDLVYRVVLHDYDSDLASAALRAPRARQLISVLARGTSGSMPKLRAEDLAGLPLPSVPTREQRDIGQLDVRRRRATTHRVEQLTRSIDLLTEYKTSLITAAVTGELDVTTAGSGIPG